MTQEEREKIEKKYSLLRDLEEFEKLERKLKHFQYNTLEITLVNNTGGYNFNINKDSYSVYILEMIEKIKKDIEIKILL